MKQNHVAISFFPLDVMRLVMALFVIAIHTTSPDRNETITRVLNMGVPFFFLVSGFFLQKKSSSDVERGNSAKRWLGRILRLFWIWTLIYLPLAVYGYISGARTLSNSLIGIVLGTGYYSWHLWYLVASILGGGVIYIYKKFRINYLVVISLAIGLLPIIHYATILWPGHYLFSEVNRIVHGIIYLLLGMAFYMLYPLFINRKAVSIVVSAAMIVLYMVFGGLYVFLGASALFCILLQLCDWLGQGQYGVSNGRGIRKMSAFVYFVHMLFVGVLSLFVGMGDSLFKFALVAILSLIAAYIRVKISFK